MSFVSLWENKSHKDTKNLCDTPSFSGHRPSVIGHRFPDNGQRTPNNFLRPSVIGHRPSFSPDNDQRTPNNLFEHRTTTNKHQTPMRILILGATGRTGRHLLAQALERGYQVQVLVRDRHKIRITHPELQVMQGHPADRACLGKAIQGCEAVLSALNISRYNDFPWAALRTPHNFLSDVMAGIIALADSYAIRRVIFTSAWGVGDTEADIPGWLRWLVKKSNLRYPYQDLYRTEELLKKTQLDWTAVRPAVLTNFKRRASCRVSLDNTPKPGLFISRATVASFMLDALEKELYVKQAPVISAG
ncbi:MAG: SDR family oxidoreductase [Sphingobacteriales bacterium]|nr:MAG: SDR family oxidoreductase [Sphingobacteriales bacterium]